MLVWQQMPYAVVEINSSQECEIFHCETILDNEGGVTKVTRFLLQVHVTISPFWQSSSYES